MEGTPAQTSLPASEYNLVPDDRSKEKRPKTAKKRRRAKGIGSLLIEKEPFATEDSAKLEVKNVWRRLTTERGRKKVELQVSDTILELDGTSEQMGASYFLQEAIAKNRRERGSEISRQLTETLIETSAEPSTERAKTLALDKHVETLSHADLLELSSKIIIDGTSLRQIYEMHLIGEQSLRRLIAEHLSGGDLRKALQYERMQREIDFERDPQLRDHFQQTVAAVTQQTLDELLRQANVGLDDDEAESAARLRAQVAQQAEAQHQERHQRQIIDGVLVAVITILLGLVIYLLFNRG